MCEINHRAEEAVLKLKSLLQESDGKVENKRTILEQDFLALCDEAEMKWGFQSQHLFRIELPRKSDWRSLKSQMEVDRISVIQHALSHLEDLFFEDTELSWWQALDFTSMIGELEQKRLTFVDNLVHEYGSSQLRFRSNNLEGEENVSLPSLFERQEGHKELDDERFLKVVRSEVCLSFNAVYPYMKELGRRVRDARAQKPQKFFLADAVAEFIENRCESHAYLCTLLQIMIVLAPNVSDIDRGFSTAKNILSNRRKRLQAEMLEALTVIAKNGPPLKSFPFKSLLSKLAEKRLALQLKRKRKRAQQSNTTVSVTWS